MDTDHQRSIASVSTSQQWARIPCSSCPEFFVAFQSLGGHSFLALIVGFPSFAGVSPIYSDITRHIQAVRDNMQLIDEHEKWILKAFTKLIVGTSGIQQVLLPEPKATCSCYNVHLVDFQYDWLLTEIFHKPYTVHPRRMWTGNIDCDWDSDIVVPSDRVITLRRVLDKAKVARMLVVMLVVSPVFGASIGHCANSAEAGLAVSAGIFALASFIQGLVAWILG